MLKRLLVMVLVLGVLAPVLGEAGAAKSGGVLKYALLRDPTGWDPHINQGATQYTFTANIYEALLRYSQKGTLEPGLAVRWENPDPTTYILHIRRNVKFHSGNPLTAEDVKFSIERILDPSTAATRSREFSVVQSVAAVDPFTVKITLKKPDAPFLELLASGEAMIVDKKWAQSGGNF
jgi:peptide/nickel transport system substrate-binding protein/glutathione transport system substrate-binding protein